MATINDNVQLHDWDAAEHLIDEQTIAGFIEAALEEASDDAAFIASVLGTVARARSITELARTTGIARETLYKMLRGEGNPTLGNVSKLAKSLGFRLSLVPIHEGKPVKRNSNAKKATAKKVA